MVQRLSLLNRVTNVARARVDGTRFVPVHHLGPYYRSKDPRHDDEHSQRVLRLKAKNAEAIEWFRGRLDELLPTSEVALVAVPASPLGPTSNGITMLIEKLADGVGRKNASASLVRTKALGAMHIHTSSRGRASLSEQIESMALQRPYAFSGRYVILLDDVMTTGATMLAALHHIKRFNSEHHVECLVLAKTASAYDERFSIDPPRSMLAEPWPEKGLLDVVGRYPAAPGDQGTVHRSMDDDIPF